MSVNPINRMVNRMRPNIRAAAIAIGLVVFLFAFRPFGLTVNSTGDALVVLGFAPLNFLIMLGIHALPLQKGPWRTVMALGSLIIANTAYLGAWSQNTGILKTGSAVGLMVGLTSLIVFLWNRGQIPEQEFDMRETRSGTVRKSFTLTGESDQEVLQLATDELLFMSANGNYVDVHYLRDRSPAKSMFRTSLAGLVAQVPVKLITQCHRSHFVNLAVARRIVRATGRTLIEFDGGGRVPISRTFRQDVLAAMRS